MFTPHRRAFWRDIDPVGAVGELIAVVRDAGTRRWWFMAFAGLGTWGMFALIGTLETRIPPKPPEIIYITTLPPGRTDAQILAENRANQHYKEHLLAEQAARAALSRNIYKAIGRASGLDVEAMDRQGRADAAAASAEQARLYGAGQDGTGKDDAGHPPTPRPNPPKNP